MAREANTASEVREYVIESLRRELIGPAPGYPMTQLNGEEILRQQDPPRYRYSAGILFPAGVNFSATLDAGEEAADIEAAIPVGEEGVDGKADEAGVEDRPEIEANTSEDKTADTDVEVDPTSTFLPSTMGLSFLARVRGGFRIECRWGTYEKTFVDGVPSHKPDGDPPSFWFRHQRSSTQDYAAEEIRRDKRARLQRRVISHAEDHGSLEIDVVSRPWDEGDARLITVTIINTGRTSRPINENCFFQCSFAIVPAGGMEILEYPGRPVSLQDDEEKSLSLLYRHRPVYAVGHGCAADWDRADGPPTSLRTETMPVFEQPPVLPLEEADGVELSMRRLAEATPTDVAISCRALCAAYRGWIEDRERELASDPDLSPKLKARGRDHLKECRACLVRVEDGISLLEAEPDALEAFQRMNIAMVEQRAHYALAAEDRFRRRWVKKPSGQMPERPFEQPDYPYETKWRPFQLAFVLMNVRSFVRPDSNERSIVDVIWFPTGGGKTEAYLVSRL